MENIVEPQLESPTNSSLKSNEQNLGCEVRRTQRLNEQGERKAMASFGARARRTLQAFDVCAARSAVSKLCSSKASGGEGRGYSLLGFASSTKQSSATRFSLQKLFNSSR